MGWVLFFDGDCAFCSSAVRRAVKLDTDGRIRYAPLQGKLAAKKGFAEFGDKRGGTMVLMRESDGRVFMRTDALIELTRVLGGWWRLLTPVRFIPKGLRDGVYNAFAKRRYWFSEKGNFCFVPDPEVQKRLLE